MAEQTMVEVADKTLMSLTDGIKAMSKAFESVAPQAWHMMVLKQRVDGIVTLAANIFCVIAAIILVPLFINKLSILMKADYDLTEWNRTGYQSNKPHPASAAVSDLVLTILYGVLGIVAIIGAICAVFCISDTIQHIVVPEYFAAQDLLKVIKP